MQFLEDLTPEKFKGDGHLLSSFLFEASEAWSLYSKKCVYKYLLTLSAPFSTLAKTLTTKMSHAFVLNGTFV